MRKYDFLPIGTHAYLKNRTTKRRILLRLLTTRDDERMNERRHERMKESKMRVFCTFTHNETCTNNELRAEFSANTHVATCFAVVVNVDILLILKRLFLRNAMKSLSCVVIKDSVIQNFTMKRHYVFR